MDNFDDYGSLSLGCEADWESLVHLGQDGKVSVSGVQNAQQFRLWEEMQRLFQIAGPSMIVQFSALFIFPQTASVVGRTLDTQNLAGFSLGSIVGNLTCMSVMTGALTAADTLLPRSFATQNYKEMGSLAIRGLVTCGAFLLAPAVIGMNANILENFFEILGQDLGASYLASRWIRIYLLGVPPMLVFRVIQSWLNAQHSAWPMVYASVIAAYLVNPLLLKVFVPALALNGSALAISITQWIMVAVLILCLIIKPSFYQSDTLPAFSKLSIRQALARRPMLEFLGLSLGGVFSLSEWWFWECSCFIAGTLGVVPLVCHTIAYNIVPILYMPCLGISMGLSIRIGHIVVHDVPKAKMLAAWSMVFTAMFGAMVSLGLKAFRLPICKLFSDDDDVIRGCEAIWSMLCCYVFILHIFGVNSAIVKALGMQWHMAAIIFVCLWLGALPGLLYFAVYGNEGLTVIWRVLPISYGVMQILLIASYTTADWASLAKEGEDALPQGSESSSPTSTRVDEGQRLLLSANTTKSSPAVPLIF